MELLEWLRQNWIWMLSFATFCGGIILYIWRRISALEKGVQALLRASMVNDWNKYSEKEFAPIYAKENFENCWLQYEALGKNGVMSEIHRNFMMLPDKQKKRGDENDA